MRILLTGASGQVGGALLHALAPIGEVIVVDRSSLDLSQPQTVAAALDELRPGLIVNPAAYTAVDLAEEQRDLAFRVNAEAPAVIAGWAADHNVPLVHFSTDYLFDGSGDEPWREDAGPAPLSAYGASKLAGEQAIRSAGGRHMIVRTSWVYAAHGRNFLRTMVQLARERPELRIVSDQFGAPTSARIIADAVSTILRQEIAGDPFKDSGGPINVAASGVTSWHGFATAIIAGLREHGVPVAVQNVAPIPASEYPTSAKRPRNSRLDLHRLRNLFNIDMPSWQQALQVELGALCEAIKNEAR